MVITTMIQECMQVTSFIDAHQYAIDQSRRLGAPAAGDRLYACSGRPYLFTCDTQDDLHLAGMTCGGFMRIGLRCLRDGIC